jgi:hypothetical protein
MTVKLVDEENDVPDDPSAYGIAAWTEEDKTVLIYDRYDIWEFSPEGKNPPKNMTNGFGRQNRSDLPLPEIRSGKPFPWKERNDHHGRIKQQY